VLYSIAISLQCSFFPFAGSESVMDWHSQSGNELDTIVVMGCVRRWPVVLTVGGTQYFRRFLLHQCHRIESSTTQSHDLEVGVLHEKVRDSSQKDWVVVDECYGRPVRAHFRPPNISAVSREVYFVFSRRVKNINNRLIMLTSINAIKRKRSAAPIAA